MGHSEKDIPLTELLAYLIETPTSPTHVGVIQIFQPPSGSARTAAQAVVKAFRQAEVDEPFNQKAVFRPLQRPKWVVCDDLDRNFHFQHISLQKPGTTRQLLDEVSFLHEGLMKRDRPGWGAFIFDGLEGNRFAVYWKIHHAYIDGTAMVMRMNAAMLAKPGQKKIVPITAPMPGLRKSIAAKKAAEATETKSFNWSGLKEAGAMLGSTVQQALGKRISHAPLPFSAANSFLNNQQHASRSLGAGTLDLDQLKAISRNHRVTINDVLMAVVGDALERYAKMRQEPLDKPLVAACPMSVRRETDELEGNRFAALLVKLGEPGSSIIERLKQVHQSSHDAKQEARSVSREGLMSYQMAVLGASSLLAKSPLAATIRPLSNINISNVPGPKGSYYLGRSKMVQGIPVSALAGCAINITCGSIDGRMDFAIISDAEVVPDAQQIADLIAGSFDILVAA